MTDPQPPQKPPFGKKQRRNLPRPEVRVDAAEPPRQKRSMLLSPAGLGTMAAIGVGALVVTNGFGSGGTRSDCTTGQVATSLAQCQAILPGAQCATAFAGGATAVGLSRTGSGPWSVQPVSTGTSGSYQTLAGQPFRLNTCRSSSSSSRSSYFWGGSSSAGRSTSGASTSQSQGVTRSGFGSTARSFSSSSSRGG
jgi:hypothetical protein